jgi:tetratricopeptide (TPR) repeat protein
VAASETRVAAPPTTDEGTGPASSAASDETRAGAAVVARDEPAIDETRAGLAPFARDAPRAGPAPFSGLAATLASHGGRARFEVTRDGESDEPDEPAVSGRTIGRHTVLARIGRGGMGEVFAAYDPHLDRKIAIKLLRPGAHHGPEAEARLLREAQAMARVSHPNIVQVYDVGVHDGQVFLAMEFIDGETLGRWISAVPPHPWPEVLRRFRAAGRGLQAAHAAGLVHRDFKPENVLHGRDGRVCVTDFGLVRAADHADAFTGASADRLRIDPLQTQAGAVLGTPAYMPPEQFLGAEVDARGDQFSFCVALWHGLYGERPFDDHDYDALRQAVLAGHPRDPPPGARVPGWLRRALLRGLRVDPAERWPSMQALLAALDRDPAQRRRWLLAGGAAALLVGAAAAALGTREDPEARCVAGAQARLAAVWSPARADGLRDMFERTGASYAAVTADYVVQAVDAHAAAWSAAAAEVCAAAHARGERSARLADRQSTCLAGQLRDADALLRVFEAADAALLERAVAAVDGLPAPARCGVEALADVAPPADPAAATQVEAAGALLARAAADDLAGRYPAGVALAGRALAAAEASGHLPTIAAARLRLGGLQGRSDDHESAADTLFDALLAAREAGDDDRAVRALVALTELDAVRRPRSAEALRWARQAEAELRGREPDPALRSELLQFKSEAESGLGDYEAALASMRAALELAAPALGGSAWREASVRSRYAQLLWGRAEYERAARELDAALATITATLGPRHPETANVLAAIGGLAWVRGDYARAEALFERVLEIRREAFGDRHTATAKTLSNLGATVGADPARQREALLLFEAALASLEAVVGPEDLALQGILDNIAGAREQLGDREGGLAMHRRNLELRLRTLGPRHPDTARSYLGVASAQLAAGEYDAAIAGFERALDIRRGAQMHWVLLARAEVGLATALHRAGRDPARVRRLARDAVDHFRTHGPQADPERAEAEQLLAELDPP